MPFAPDDLPRSPTGRVPQWVVDEANGRSRQDTEWRVHVPATDVTPARARWHRRPLRPATTLLVMVAIAALWFVSGGVERLPPGFSSALGSLPFAPPPSPSADVVALAEEAHLSPSGRDLLFGARPALLNAGEFAGQCDEGHARTVPSGAVGCYRGSDGTIAVYVPTDPRLRGFVVETTAHEVLHVAWTTLSPRERSALVPVLESEVAELAADDPVHEQIAGSTGGRSESRPTELFAYVGTQVWRDGGLAEPLESTYARFVDDRAALVAVHEAFDAQMTQLVGAIETGYRALSATEAANALSRAQYEADRATLAAYRQAYEEKVAELAAMPAAQRARLQLSWTWWDGTALPMAAASRTLAAAADLLARDEGSMPARLQAVVTADAAAAAERARVDALKADYDALQDQLSP